MALLAGWLAADEPAAAERLVASLSRHQVLVTSSFTGTSIVLFGSVERDARRSRRRAAGYDIVVTVTGPRQTLVDAAQGARARHLGQRRLAHLRRCAVLSRGAVEPAARRTSPTPKRCAGCSSASTTSCCRSRSAPISATSARDDPFRAAFMRLKTAARLYVQQTNGVTFLTPTLFRAAIPLPAEAPVGNYDVDVKLFADGALLARTNSAFEIVKVGFEQFVANAAREHGLLYGLATAVMALVTGWFASVVFRRD